MTARNVLATLLQLLGIALIVVAIALISSPLVGAAAAGIALIIVGLAVEKD